MNTQARHLRWLCLLIGFTLVPFIAWQTVIPLAAWLAPVFLLRFARTQKRFAGSLIFLAYMVGIFIATSAALTSNTQLNILNFLLVPLFRGVMYSLPYRADRLVGSRLGEWGRLFVFPLAFTTVDWVMSVLRVIATPGSPAYSQYDNLALMQIVSITGMWGITFLIAWFSSTVNLLWEHDFDWRPIRNRVGLFASVLLAVFLFGSARTTFAPPSSQTVPVATISPDPNVSTNATDAIGWLTFNKSTNLERASVRPKFAATVDQMMARSETALRGGAKIVSWRELAGLVLEENKQNVLQRASTLAKQYNAYLEVSLGVFTRSDKLPYVHNQSILIDNMGNVAWTYDKTHPVPFTEESAVISGSGEIPTADTPYGRLGGVICFDQAYPALLLQAGQKHVDILLGPSNDTVPYAVMNSTFAIYRAIENGYSLVDATGAGISTITDYEGRILGRQDFFTDSTGIMLSTIPTRGVTTIYSQIGDTFAYLSIAVLIVLVIWAFVPHVRPAPVSQPNPA